MDLYLAGSTHMKVGDLGSILGRLMSYEYQKKEIDKLIQETERVTSYMDIYLSGAEPLGNLEFENVTRHNENILISYSRKSDSLRIIETFNKKLFIDSGAFTAFTKGKKIDVDEYIDFINKRTDNITIFAQVDTIPGTLKLSNMKEEYDMCGRKTWENYLYMYDRLKEPRKMLYTYHIGEPIEYLINALEWKDRDGYPIDYMAIGGLAAYKMTAEAKIQAISQIINIIKKSSNPNIKIHAFGMTTYEVLQRFPEITSADSTSWIMVAAMGSIMTDYGNILVSTVQENNFNHFSNLPKQAIINVENKIQKFGFTLNDLKDNSDNRLIYNARYLLDKFNNIEYIPMVNKRKLF